MQVLHVVDADLARGAQRGAQMLRDALDHSSSHGDSHRLATIFDAATAVLEPDVSLDVTDGRGRRFGIAPAAIAALHRDPAAQAADILVAHGGESLKYLSSARLPGVIIYHKIGTVGHHFDRWASARVHRWAVSRADAVVAISDDSRIEAVELLAVEPERVTVIPNGRDPLVFRPLEQPRHPNRTTLTFLGHLTQTKRPERFLDVVERLVDRGFPIDATIAGDGPLRESLRVRAAALGVEMAGSVDDVADLLRSTDVLVFTSVREGEGMPGVLIEASMSGAVPVATDVPGARQVIGDRTTGFVVDPEDLEALVDRVGLLITNPTRRTEMARAGRNRTVANFSTKVVADQWDHVCRRVIASKLCASSI